MLDGLKPALLPPGGRSDWEQRCSGGEQAQVFGGGPSLALVAFA